MYLRHAIRLSFFAATICLCVGGARAAEEDLGARLAEVLEKNAHPRLFGYAGEDEALRAHVADDPLLTKVADHIIATSRALIDVDPLTRNQVGKRLLGVSRDCLQRVSYLAMAYRLTGEEAFAARAETEMLAAAGFSDWNPDHFLDVAEMTTALAIGYDWLYPVLSEEGRGKIRDGIIEKGLKPGMDGGWWVTTTNNWNQVCHGGLTMGALAVLEDVPDLAEETIARGLKYVPRAMHEYEPDGVYPEGPSYWKYGTTYNVLHIDVLNTVLGSDFGLADAAGFMASPEFYLHATGPTGKFYNFSDCGTTAGVSTAMYWFAAAKGDPGLLFREVKEMEAYVAEGVRKDAGGTRSLPFVLLWKAAGEAGHAPETLHWQGDGPTPVAMHRTSWDREATYAGIKGGSPHTNHAHMDIGSFVIDMKGVRWAEDLGSQSYHSLESKGVDLWNRSQDSERWTVFRLNNMSHNTLVIDDQLQRVKGDAPITTTSLDPENPFTVVDMTPVYEGQIARAVRGLKLVGEAVLVQDELETLDKETSVRWGMATRASVSISEAGDSATLAQGDASVALQVLAPEDVRLEVLDMETPPQPFDAKNPDTRMVAFTVSIPAGESAQLAVLLTGDGGPSPTVVPLTTW